MKVYVVYGIAEELDEFKILKVFSDYDDATTFQREIDDERQWGQVLISEKEVE